MHTDLYNITKSLVGLSIQTIATDTDTNGAIIDTQGFESGKVVLASGVITAGDITIKEIQEDSDITMASATVIPAERLIGTPAVMTASDSVSELGFVSTKRYVRVVFTTANSADLTVGANVELGSPVSTPTK